MSSSTVLSLRTIDTYYRNHDRDSLFTVCWPLNIRDNSDGGILTPDTSVYGRIPSGRALMGPRRRVIRLHRTFFFSPFLFLTTSLSPLYHRVPVSFLHIRCARTVQLRPVSCNLCFLSGVLSVFIGPVRCLSSPLYLFRLFPASQAHRAASDTVITPEHCHSGAGDDRRFKCCTAPFIPGSNLRAHPPSPCRQ